MITPQNDDEIDPSLREDVARVVVENDTSFGGGRRSVEGGEERVQGVEELGGCEGREFGCLVSWLE